MTPNKQWELCFKELDIIQDNINRFDQNGLTIKSWCLTTWSLIAVYGLQNSNRVLVGIGAFTVLIFSFTEFIYRRFQRRFIQRSKEIETILATGDLGTYRYSVHKSATTCHKSDEIRFVLCQPQFSVFYISLIVLSILLVVYLSGFSSAGAPPIPIISPTVQIIATPTPFGSIPPTP
jgi:hypothetical protein